MKPCCVWIVVLLAIMATDSVRAWSHGFHGTTLRAMVASGAKWTMRKQKASDKKRTRLLRIQDGATATLSRVDTTTTTSPMELRGAWALKKLPTVSSSSLSQGRGRSRKRQAIYRSAAHYQDTFLSQLTAEYQAEEAEVLGRIRQHDPWSLERAGQALLNMRMERRGNLCLDEVYRLTKDSPGELLPPHKFSTNDVVVLTVGGDSSPLQNGAVTIEARVLATGPTYLNIVVPAGLVTTILGEEFAPLRFRIDRFFSNIPYQRMVEAVTQLTTPKQNDDNESHLDDLLRQVILNTYHEVDSLVELNRALAKPMRTTAQVRSMPLHPQFRNLNASQWAALQAAWTRRLTLIQGPPGSGKTCVAAAAAAGLVNQCHRYGATAKVLATANSNVATDHFGLALMRLGLSVIRIGAPSAVATALLEYTLDAAISRQPAVQQARAAAVQATAALSVAKNDKSSSNLSLLTRAATQAVQQSWQVCVLWFVMHAL
jgi:AAA domain